MALNEDQHESRRVALRSAREDFLNLAEAVEEQTVLDRAEKYRAFLDGDDAQIVITVRSGRVALADHVGLGDDDWEKAKVGIAKVVETEDAARQTR